MPLNNLEALRLVERQLDHVQDTATAALVARLALKAIVAHDPDDRPWHLARARSLLRRALPPDDRAAA